MSERVIHASIDAPAKKVTLQGTEPPQLKQGDTFDVTGGDTLKWVLKDAPPASKVKITFVKFPDPRDERSLFDKPEKPLESSAGVITSGSVNPQAFSGHYGYEVRLIEGNTQTVLTCFWTNGAAEILLDGMGGGVQSGGPAVHQG